MNTSTSTIVSYMCMTTFAEASSFSVEYATSPLVVAQVGKYVHQHVEQVMKADRSTTPVVLQYTHSTTSAVDDNSTTFFGAALRLSGSHNACVTVFSRLQLHQTMMQLLCDVADRVDYSVLASEAACRQFSNFMSKLVNTLAADVVPMYPLSVGPISILRPDDSALSNVGTPLSALVYCFPPDAIRLMTSIMLQEGRIVFVGPGCSLGAAAAAALLAILSPLQWVHPVFSCLSEQFLPLLHDLDTSGGGKPFVGAIDSGALPSLMLMGMREPLWIADCRTGKIGLCRSNATTLPNAGIQQLIGTSDRLRDSIRKFVSPDQQRQWLRQLAAEEHTHCPPALSIPNQRELLLSFLEYNVAHLLGNYRKGVAPSLLSSPSPSSSTSPAAAPYGNGSVFGAFDWSKFLPANLDGNVRYATTIANTLLFSRFVQWILALERNGKVALRDLNKTPFLEICTKRFPELYSDILPPEKNSTASATGKFFMSMMTKAKGAVVSTIVGQVTCVPMMEFVQAEMQSLTDVNSSGSTPGLPAAAPVTPQSPLAQFVSAGSAAAMPKVPRLPLDVLYNFGAYHSQLWCDERSGGSCSRTIAGPTSASPPAGSPVTVIAKTATPKSPSAPAGNPSRNAQAAPSPSSPTVALVAPAPPLDLFDYVSYPSADGGTHKIQCPTEVEHVRQQAAAAPSTSPHSAAASSSQRHADPAAPPHLDVDRFFS